MVKFIICSLHRFIHFYYASETDFFFYALYSLEGMFAFLS